MNRDIETLNSTVNKKYNVFANAFLHTRSSDGEEEKVHPVLLLFSQISASSFEISKDKPVSPTRIQIHRIL
jgi:hypothetical protein